MSKKVPKSKSKNKASRPYAVFSYAVIASMLAQITYPLAPVYAVEQVATTQDNINLVLSQPKPIDVVLTLGSTNVNAANFQNDLKAKLQAKGVDLNRVQITAIDTKQQNLQSSFTWIQNVSSSIGSIAIQNNGTKIQMFGNPTNAGFNKIYTANNNDPELKEQTMNFDYTLDFGDSFDGAGVLFNTNVVNGLLSGYAIFFPQSGGGVARIYKLTNWTNTYAEDISSNANAQQIGTMNMGTSGSFTLKTTKNALNVYKSGAFLGTIALPQHFGWGLGFFGDHYSHGCNRIGEFSLNNISLSQTKSKEFNEIIRQPSWRDDSQRYVVNLADQTINDFDSPTVSGEILTRLINENIHFLELGTDANKVQSENFIQRNNGNGAFYYNNNYDVAVTNVADYIVNRIQNTDQPQDSPYVLAGTPLNINVSPEQFKTNTANADYPQGRWKLDQDFNYFDNNLGQETWSNQWRNDLPTEIDKPGKYELWFGDTHPSPQYIYVHRKPVANFSVGLSKGASSATATVTNLSYDPDKQSDADKGIAEVEWKWKETTATTWNEGALPSDLPLGKNYLVQLRVKDYQGTWSNETASYIATDTAVVTKPVANFTIPSSTITMYEPLNVQDVSYEPSGRAIVDKTWTITKTGTVVYSGATLPANFTGIGSGNFVISLKVKNDAGLWSEAYSRGVTVTVDNLAPEAIITPASTPWGTTDVTVTAKFTEPGGSGFSGQRYAISSSPDAPTTGWSDWSTSLDREVTVTDSGKIYVHFEAKDNAGNLLKRTVGPIQIDKQTELNAPIIHHDKDSFTIDTNNPNSPSGIKEVLYKINDGEWIKAGADNVIPDGTYTISVKVVNNVGLESPVTSEVITFAISYDNSKTALDLAMNLLLQLEAKTPQILQTDVYTQATLDQIKSQVVYATDLAPKIVDEAQKLEIEARIKFLNNRIAIIQHLITSRDLVATISGDVNSFVIKSQTGTSFDFSLITREKIELINKNIEDAKASLEGLPSCLGKTLLQIQIDVLIDSVTSAGYALDAFEATTKVDGSIVDLSTQEYINIAIANYNAAKDKVSLLPCGQTKLDLLNKLINIRITIEIAQQILDAKNAVANIEGLGLGLNSTQDDINLAINLYIEANALVQNLPEGPAKEELKERVTKINIDIDIAKKLLIAKAAISKLEGSLPNENSTQIDIDIAVKLYIDAKGLVDLLPEGDAKETLKEKLVSINITIDIAQKILDAKNAVVKLEGVLPNENSTQIDIDIAIKLYLETQGLVDALPDGPVKQGLKDKLVSINITIEIAQKILDAKNAIIKVQDVLPNENSTQVDIDIAIKLYLEAQGLVDALPDGPVKQQLSDQLLQIKITIDLAQNILNAKNAVAQAEGLILNENTSQADFDIAINIYLQAKGFVDSLPDGDLKEGLLSRLVAVKINIDFVQTILNAKNAVIKAEASVPNDYSTQVDIDIAIKLYLEAYDLVDALPDGQVKQDLLNKLIQIKITIDLSQTALNARNQVVKAETAANSISVQVDVELAIKELDTAKALVDALPDGNLKIELKLKIEAIQARIYEGQADVYVKIAETASVSLPTYDAITIAQKAKDFAEVYIKESVGNATAATALNDRLLQVQIKINIAIATLKTNQASKTLDLADVDIAQKAIDILPDGNEKTAIQIRLNLIISIINSTGDVDNLRKMLVDLQNGLKGVDLNLILLFSNRDKLNDLYSKSDALINAYLKIAPSIYTLGANDPTLSCAEKIKLGELKSSLSEISGLSRSIRIILDDSTGRSKVDDGNVHSVFKFMLGSRSVDLATNFNNTLLLDLDRTDNIQWVSLHGAVASVNDAGVVTRKSMGIAKIAAYNDHGVYYFNLAL
ncbi:hypothetical protein [Clostridium cellulovorans]|uniref:Uncharacterized protein n=1 Tax=Clostridium cellulovorans (strain ATCC 35296 / DSM 3052 / OCM 3 / 743B) TaxID=573061 RepID=D9SPK5_CLOC7|nr:hypothetical protein [Clostridium cellulovorans]ADL50054.1 hypothetical protein Clocel_0272 [Clostridium cellulovorans 743B]